MSYLSEVEIRCPGCKRQMARVHIPIYLFYAACCSLREHIRQTMVFPLSYTSRKQNSVWNVIYWVHNPLWICGKYVSLSAYLCQPVLLAFSQDYCHEFRDLFEKGRLSCTRENDPVRDSSGKQHSNKCIMCMEKLWVEEKSLFCWESGCWSDAPAAVSRWDCLPLLQLMAGSTSCSPEHHGIHFVILLVF